MEQRRTLRAIPIIEMMAGSGSVLPRGFIGLYRFSKRAFAKTFSLLVAGSFAEFGSATVIQPPIRLEGESRIAIGSGVFIGSGCWLQVLEHDLQHRPAIVIGDGTSIAGNCVISAARSIRLGRKVLLARNVYISDHSHGFEDRTQAILDQGVTRVAPVEIGDGAWLGQNVVVFPGVRIGQGAVVGANAVVRDDVPDYSVAAGVPATVIRTLTEQETLR
jgi:acetyltransferase-like isoleucine patch superfamily enzyme